MTEPVLRYREIHPPAELEPFVRCIWRLRGASDGAAEPIIPDGCAELIVNVGERFTRQLSATSSYRQTSRFVVGQITRAVTIAPAATVDVWGIRFHPWCASRLFGVPAREMRDREVLLDDVARELDRALDRLVEARDEAAAERMLLESLARAARHVERPTAEVRRLVAYVAGHSDTMSIGRLARESGVGVRRLQTIFRDHVGLSPKQLLRVTRFQHALRLARERPAWSWGRVAHGAGYYDHAHFVHDANDLAGCPPSVLARREAPLTDMFLSDE